MYVKDPDVVLRSRPQLNPIQSPINQTQTTNTRNFDNFSNLNTQSNFQHLNYNVNSDRNESVSPNSLTNHANLQSQSNSFQLPQPQSDFNIIKNSETDPPLSLQNLFGIYESILPVIYNDKEEEDPITSNNTSCLSFDSSLPVRFKMKGQFEIVHIKERNLTFRKKEFLEPYDFFRELKIMK